MCLRSQVGEYYTQQWHAQPQPIEEVKLKFDMENLRKLLLLAGAIDDANGETDCPMEEKVELIKALARSVDVDMEDVFPER